MNRLRIAISIIAAIPITSDATVEDPCALFKIAESKNGKKMPIAESTVACSEILFTAFGIGYKVGRDSATKK